MDDGATYLAKPSRCHYLPDREWRLEYRINPRLDRNGYLDLINQGWRRFGWTLFRPLCMACRECQPIRVLVDSFRPDRSQRRVQKCNAQTRLEISNPRIDSARIDIYYRHHEHHSETKGWTPPNLDDAISHMASIIDGPFPVEEWSYYLDEKLVAVSYIDVLADGFSGIYFYHDPDYRKMSLGTWMCLSMIEEAARRKLPYVYLGYYIKDCRSMAYKGRFVPNQILNEPGLWVDYLT